MYADESGDPGNNTTQTRYFCLSGIVVHESDWRQFIETNIQFRRTMRDVYGLPLRVEIHAIELIRKQQFNIEKFKRLAILRNYLDELAKLNSISVTNIVVDKQGKSPDFDIFGAAWRTLFQRFENTLTHGNFPGGYRRSFGTVYTDATSGKRLSQIMREMASYNPIPNRLDAGYRNIPILRIIEDPSERNSAVSLPIHACDVIAYFLHQKHKPNSFIRRRRAQNYFDRLDPVLNKHASISDPQGVVRI
ncbi:MAG: DUF3800 domain-containing protein [Paracoccaceae bacterium]